MAGISVDIEAIKSKAEFLDLSEHLGWSRVSTLGFLVELWSESAGSNNCMVTPKMIRLVSQEHDVDMIISALTKTGFLVATDTDNLYATSGCPDLFYWYTDNRSSRDA